MAGRQPAGIPMLPRIAAVLICQVRGTAGPAARGPCAARSTPLPVYGSLINQAPAVPIPTISPDALIPSALLRGQSAPR